MDLTQAVGDNAATDAPSLRPRVPHSRWKRPCKPDDLTSAWRNRIAVKFREGTGVRARGGKLAIEPSKVQGPFSPADELSAVKSVLQGLRDYVALRIAPLPEDAMDELRAAGEQHSAIELADMNLWYYVYVEPASDEALAALLDDLNALPIVEIAEPTMRLSESTLSTTDRLPWPSAATMAERETVSAHGESVVPRHPNVVPKPSGTVPLAPRTLSNFVPDQQYLNAAPVGMDVQWLRTWYSWNLGQGVELGIVEQEWDPAHREFVTGPDQPNILAEPGHLPPQPLPTFPWYDQSSFEHGTATLGIFSATPDDNLGTSGIVPRANEVWLASWQDPEGDDVPGAILSLVPHLFKGSVIDLESGGPVGACTSAPLETSSAVWDAIRHATANGISVVEPAGNGNCNLDDEDLFPKLAHPENAAFDSGAIIVAAGYRTSRSKWTTSNYGHRVDAHAEGDAHVVTTGYGNKHPGGTPPPISMVHEWYTWDYKDTSASTPQVAAAVAHLSAISVSYHGTILTPATLRDMIRRSGSSYAGTLPIGKRPDLKKHAAQVQNFFVQTRSTKLVGGPHADYVNWDPGTGVWRITDPMGTATSFLTFGHPGQIPVIADFHSGNGTLADIVVYDLLTGNWTRNSGGLVGEIIGTTLPDSFPIPVECEPGFYGPELAVFTPYATTGYYNPSGKGRFLIRRYYQFGIWRNQIVEWGDAFAYGTPLVGDLMGDSTESKDELVVVNMSPGGSAVWHIIMDPYNPADLTKQTSFAWGIEGDVFLTCKVPNANGKPLRAAVYRPSVGQFKVRVPEAVGGKVESVAFGQPGDVPACIDVDGNGTDDFVLWRPSERRWYRNSATSWKDVPLATADSHGLAK